VNVEKRILLAGPVAGPLRGAAATLEKAGYEVYPVDSPELLETFEAGKPPDLVLVDEAFGPDGGVALCRSLRTNQRWRHVSLMLVVPAGEQHLEECLVAGINDFILAPFPPDELLDKVRRLTVIPARREMNTLVRLRDPRQGTTLLGKTINISLSGLLIEIETPLSIGRVMDLEFFLPEELAVVKAKGRVIRRAMELDLFHPAYGIRFTEVSDEDRARIDAYVSAREGTAGAEDATRPGERA
jgi:CheY-like chemotaxis protein